MNDMTRVKNTTFISSYENLASDDYCDRMIEAWEKIYADSSLREHGSDGSVANNGAKHRKDFALYFDDERNNTQELQQETNKILDEGLRKYCAEYPSLDMLQYYSTRIKVQRTPPKGGFHAWHTEHNFGEASTRILTWTIYLNDIPKGEGETEFFEYGIKVQPKKGSVCFFPASFTHTHRGNSVYTHNKYIATGWYYKA
jgi:hypothetical protein|tara:strand:+ start:1804 stop:2400 length:597 start_codon:yes stop_codon:yes gene_type:complete